MVSGGGGIHPQPCDEVKCGTEVVSTHDSERVLYENLKRLVKLKNLASQSLEVPPQTGQGLKILILFRQASFLSCPKRLLTKRWRCRVSVNLLVMFLIEYPLIRGKKSNHQKYRSKFD
jgi:hypothetical protein